MRIAFGGLALVALLAVAGCSGGDGDGGATCPTRDRGVLADESADGNVTLYLSNQSFERPSVDMRLTLDDVPIIDTELAVCDQHEFVQYRFRWTAGDHVLRAVSSQGGADDRQTIAIGSAPVWIFTWYGYDQTEAEGVFGFHVSDEPIRFQ